MFTTIFKYELQFWLRQVSVYIYAGLFFTIAMVSMGGLAGMWDAHTNEPTSIWMANAPIKINEVFIFFNKLILFLVPAIIGQSIYRDYNSRMHTVLYSYPIGKTAYLAAKFCSSFVVLSGIVACIGVGLYVGTLLPGVNTSMLIPFQSAAYGQPYFYYALPNLLCFGAIVFAVVWYTRNIYVGFISILILLFVQGLSASLLGDIDNQWIAALLDPMGEKAAGYATAYWTVNEQNTLLLPISKVSLYNRLLWVLVGGGILFWVHRNFRFSQQRVGAKKSSKSLSSNRLYAEGGIPKIDLPKIKVDFSSAAQWKLCWQLSNFDFRYIISSWMFLSLVLAGMLFIIFQQAELNPAFGIKTFPVTWKMLKIPALLFLGVIHLLTFLFAGLLIQRAKMANCQQLVDSCAIPNWVLLGSKFLALVKMQLLLLMGIMIGGVLVQFFSGYYHVELGLYFFYLLCIYLPGLIIWTLAAVFIQTLFTNAYLGFFLLLLASMGVAGLPELGIEHFIFRYNMGPDYTYSSMEGFGSSLPPFYLYKFYWSLFGGALVLMALLLWIRGLPQHFWERLQIARRRFHGRLAWGISLLLLAFVSMGASIYYVEHWQDDKIHSHQEEVLWKVEHEQLYKQYEKLAQPRITGLNIALDIFPDRQDFVCKGAMQLINRAAQPIDTLLINYSYDEQTSYHFDRPAKTLFIDTVHRLDMHQLEEALAPGDSMLLHFTVKNTPNTFFVKNNLIKTNGTFFTDEFLPGIGYQPIELTNNQQRKKYGLPHRPTIKPMPHDSAALHRSYSSIDADWLDFEATLSTAGDQIAIAPGYLQKRWQADGRSYFHYKMNSKIKDFFGFNSGRYEVLQENWNGLRLEIYYHKGHGYNLDRMLKGLKRGLAYSIANFSPYQHQQARIIEFPVTMGRHATTFANSIPFSELYFIMEVDDTDPEQIDLPFYVTVHEIAHQWWGNQLIPADVLGARMLTESLAEYTALKVMEKEYGKPMLRNFLKLDLDVYLKGRGREQQKEVPLIYAHARQEYITYRKGALVFYALSDYLGEESLNRVLRNYLEKVKFQNAPYTTSLELLKELKTATPDSLQYLLTDLFETITLYDNRIVAVTSTPLADGRYEVAIELEVRKYRSDGIGQQYYSNVTGDSTTYQCAETNEMMYSLPLADYIEIGIFGEVSENPLYLERHKMEHIHNKLTIIVDQKPVEVGVDPYNKLIDAQPWDNRKRLWQGITSF